MMDVVVTIAGGVTVGLGILFLFILINTMVASNSPLARATRRANRMEKKLARVQQKETIARIKFESVRAMYEKLEKVK